MDSTQLLYEYALKYDRELIHAVTVVNVGNSNKQIKSEYIARKKIKTEFKKRKISNVQFHEINVSSTLNRENRQAPIWFNYVMPSISDGDILYMAYLSSDGFDFFHYKPLLEDSFKSISKLRDINATLEFPFMQLPKGDIINSLKKNRLLRLTSYCGQPNQNLTPCGKCMKCMSVKRWSNYKKGDYV